MVKDAVQILAAHLVLLNALKLQTRHQLNQILHSINLSDGLGLLAGQVPRFSTHPRGEVWA
jgi:UV DNA damage repair endonuclease